MVVVDMVRHPEVSEPEPPRAAPVPLVATGHRAEDVDRAPRRPSWSWRPLSGAALLERLRVTGRPRPVADPVLATRLRAGLIGALGLGDGDGAATRSDAEPLLISKERLNRVLTCAAHRPVRDTSGTEPSIALACGALIGALFRQLVTVGGIGDPMVDGLGALSVDPYQRELVPWIEQLPPGRGQELRAEVIRQADSLQRRWPPLDPGWLPRTQESLRVGLAHGSVQLVARVDLAVGRPGLDEASVAMVEVKSGARRLDHAADLQFYALVETLRRGVPPFVMATYYTRTGELDVEPVTEQLLVAACRRVVAGARALRESPDGFPSGPGPATWCASCLTDPVDEFGPAGPGATVGRP